jgi:NCK-associated protein 1
MVHGTFGLDDVSRASTVNYFRLSSIAITLLPHESLLILHAFMDLLCAFVCVKLFFDKVVRKMVVQIYNLLHTMLRSGRDYEFYHHLV